MCAALGGVGVVLTCISFEIPPLGCLTVLGMAAVMFAAMVAASRIDTKSP